MEDWKKELFACLTREDIDLPNIKGARLLRAKNAPNSVFKIRGVNKYSLDNLENDTVWVSSPDNFNDPFDSLHLIDSKALLDDKDADALIDIMLSSGALNEISQAERCIVGCSDSPFDELVKMSLIKGRFPHDDYEKLSREIIELMNRISQEHTDELIKTVLKGHKVCCFTEDNESILMWSHYGDCHRGVSIEYDVVGNPEQGVAADLWPVVYSRGIFDATRYMQSAVKGRSFNNLYAFVACLHKSEEWSYEKEWRIVLPLGPGHPSYNRMAQKPKAVYLGAKISDNDKTKIIEISCKKNVPVFQMKLSSNGYSLSSELLKC